MNNEDLNKKLKENGMFSIEEMLSKESNYLDTFTARTSVVDLESFEDWLYKRYKQILLQRISYELGEKNQDDEMYEWILSFSGVLREVISNWKQANGK